MSQGWRNPLLLFQGHPRRYFGQLGLHVPRIRGLSQQASELSLSLIRQERPEDTAAIRVLLRASFPTDAEAGLVDALRGGGLLAVSLVAEADGRVAGYIAFSPVSTSGSSGLGLAPVVVAESCRRQGIGAGLVRAGLEQAAATGAGWVVVLGDPGYYGRFGFIAASAFGLVDEYGGGEGFQGIELIDGAAPRAAGLVRYCAPFAMFG